MSTPIQTNDFRSFVASREGITVHVDSLNRKLSYTGSQRHFGAILHDTLDMSRLGKQHIEVIRDVMQALLDYVGDDE